MAKCQYPSYSPCIGLTCLTPDQSCVLSCSVVLTCASSRRDERDARREPGFGRTAPGARMSGPRDSVLDERHRHPRPCGRHRGLRTAFAVALAKDHGAHLIGVAFAPTALLPLYGADVGLADMSEALEAAK